MRVDRAPLEAGEQRGLVFAISADYARRTGGWVYDDRLMRELRALGWHVRDVTLPAGFPDPDCEARAASEAALAALPVGTIVVVDQLCLGVMPDVAERLSRRLCLVMIVHHPLALERAGPTTESETLFENERRALTHVAMVIVTSGTTAGDLRDRYDVPEARIVIARPGVDLQPVAPGSSSDALSLLTLGAVVPRKDHGTLISALSGLAALPWRLTIVGNTTRAPDHVASLQEQIVGSGLSERVTIAGELDDAALARMWSQTDIYVASARHEGYGMAIAEAIARGLPVVTTAAGAVPEWLPPQAATRVPPEDADALREALHRVMADRGELDRLRAGARAARQHQAGWEKTAAIVDAALARLLIRA